MSPNVPPFLRVNDGFLAAPEHRLLEWLVVRLPASATPDRLTALGFAGALVIFGGYLLAARYPAGLWLANAGLVINWFGDSLDGRVARRHGIQRPRYGFFLDQSIDVVSQLLLATGLGISGYLRFETAALCLAAFYMMTVQGLLRVEVSRVFNLASGGIGLTEVRCLLLAMNVLFYLVPPTPFTLFGFEVTYADILGFNWIAINLGLYIVGMIVVLKRLAREEPARSRPGTDPNAK